MIFSLIQKPGRAAIFPGVDSASNRNEYQPYFLGGKGARLEGLTTLSPSYAGCLQIWEPQPPGTFRACPDHGFFYLLSYLTHYTGQQRFCPMRKNVCFWRIFGRWIQICFQNFSITHSFRTRLKGWNLLRQDTSAMKNSRISFPRKMVSCFAMMFVPLWKFLVMNITQISGACSLIRQKWAWKWFYSTTKIDSPPFLWLMQPTWRKVMKAWSYFLERLRMTNLSGSYVVISRLWHCYSECNSGTQIVLFPVRVGQPGQEESLCK